MQVTNGTLRRGRSASLTTPTVCGHQQAPGTCGELRRLSYPGCRSKQLSTWCAQERASAAVLRLGAAWRRSVARGGFEELTRRSSCVAIAVLTRQVQGFQREGGPTRIPHCSISYNADIDLPQADVVVPLTCRNGACRRGGLLVRMSLRDQSQAGRSAEPTRPPMKTDLNPIASEQQRCGELPANRQPVQWTGRRIPLRFRELQSREVIDHMVISELTRAYRRIWRTCLARGGAAYGRDRIVAAAADLTYRHGVAGTSTPAVRDAAGVSSSQIYPYFADKDDLTRAVIAFQTDAILAHHAPFLARIDSLDALCAWRDVVVDAARQQHGAGGCPLGGLCSELSDDHPWARDALAASFTAWSEAIRAGVNAMTGNGTLPARPTWASLPSHCSPPCRADCSSLRPSTPPTPSKPPWTPSSRTSATTRQNPPGDEARTGPRTPGPGKRPAAAASCPGHGAWLLPGWRRADPRRRAGAGLYAAREAREIFRALGRTDGVRDA